MPDRLAALLEDWRVYRTVEHAAAVAERSAELLGGFVPPIADDARAFHRAWIAAARHVVTRGWAVTALTDGLPGPHGVGQLGALAKRIETLVRCGPDPRTARAVADAIARDPGVLAYRRVYAAALHALCDSGDVATDRIVAAVDAPTSRIGELRAELEHHAALERVRQHDLVPRLPHVHVEATPQTRALWRAVLANLDDLDARTVLGDALLAAGDPRGELFALQLASGGDLAERRRRVALLLASYGAEWIGGLKAVASWVGFHGGLVASIALVNGNLRRIDVGRVLDDPVLATIEVALGRSASDGDYIRLIDAPAMTALRAIEVRSDQVAQRLPSLRAPIRHVAVIDDAPLRGRPAGRDLLRDVVLPACAACPQIRSFGAWTRAIAPLAGSALLDRMIALTLAGPFAAALAVWRQLPRVVELTLAPTPGLEIASGESDRLVLTRDGAAVVARATGPWLLRSLDGVLRLVDGLTRVEIESDDQLVERIRGELAPRGVAVVRVDAREHDHAFAVPGSG